MPRPRVACRYNPSLPQGLLTCTRCGHQKRVPWELGLVDALGAMRQECPRGEDNWYAVDDADEVLEGDPE